MSGVSGPVLADPASRWSDLTLRVLSALVLLPVAVLCLWAGGWWFAALAVIGWIGLGVEWAALCGYSATAWPGIVLPVTGALAVLCAAAGVPWAGLVSLAVGGAVIAVSSRFTLALGVPYIGLAAIALVWLRADPVAGWPNALFVLSVIWASDIGAYMTGRLLGGPKLAPSLSPGKTWSGAMGGLISAVLAALAVAACFSSEFSPSHVTGLALLLSLVSQAGDLFESALKRHFGVKDSGHVIPGHGGLLDRLDALLTVAPAAALLALSVGRGVVLWR